MNPALIPKGDLFIGLPVLSGVHFNVNNRLSYNDLFTKEGGEVLVQRDKVLSNLATQNIFTTQANINLFYVGFKTKTGALFSLSANERVEVDVLYPKEIIDYFWNGNRQFLSEDINFAKIGGRATHFREIALGVATPVNDQLTVGLKGKFLVGFFNASTPGNLKAKLTSSGEAFQVDAEWNNAGLRTSGLNIYQGDPVDGKEIGLGSHLIMNSNTGVAVDIGATYHLNKYYTVTGSLIDVGFISWKEDIESHTLNDTTFRYEGVSLRSISDIRQTIEDSLLSKFETNQNSDPYKTWLPVKAYGSWIYHYSKNTDFYISGGARLVQRQLKMMYGGGVTQKFGKVFTGSLSVTKLPQQFFNAGAAFAVNGGPVQMYMAADQVINFSAPDFKSFDFRFGINFVFNKKQEEASDAFGSRPPIGGARGVDTNAFLGRRVKTKKREGIYSIIKRQKKRELKNKRTQRDKDVEKKSLTGRSGKKNEE